MIIGIGELAETRKTHKDFRIALRFGCYDLLHAGHQVGIDYAAARADLLVLGVMPDKYVTGAKGPHRPYNGENSRLATIDQARGVDYSFLAPASSIGLAGVLLALRPDIYVEDEEYGEGRLKSLFLRSVGTDYLVHHYDKTISTSRMIATLGVAQAVAQASLAYSPETVTAA